MNFPSQMLIGLVGCYKQGRWDWLDDVTSDGRFSLDDVDSDGQCECQRGETLTLMDGVIAIK